MAQPRSTPLELFKWLKRETHGGEKRTESAKKRKERERERKKRVREGRGKNIEGGKKRLGIIKDRTHYLWSVKPESANNKKALLIT